MFGRHLVRISAIQTETFRGYFTVHPHKYRDSTSIRSRRLPSKSFPFTNIPVNAMYCPDADRAVYGPTLNLELANIPRLSCMSEHILAGGVTPLFVLSSKLLERPHFLLHINMTLKKIPARHVLQIVHPQRAPIIGTPVQLSCNSETYISICTYRIVYAAFRVSYCRDFYRCMRSKGLRNLG